MSPGDGDPVAAGLHVAMMRRDVAAVRETLAAYAGDDLSTLISTASRSRTGAYAWLRAERGNMGDDPLMLTLLGCVTIDYAWRIRTSYGAQNVSRQQFADFHGALREAEEHLYRAVEFDPESAAPWAHLVTSGRGLQIGLEAIERRFEAAVQRCPNHRIAHQQMLQASCSGSAPTIGCMRSPPRRPGGRIPGIWPTSSPSRTLNAGSVPGPVGRAAPT